MQIGRNKDPTLLLYAPAATQKERYCGKMLSHTKSSRLVTDNACQSSTQIWSNQVDIYLY